MLFVDLLAVHLGNKGLSQKNMTKSVPMPFHIRLSNASGGLDAPSCRHFIDGATPTTQPASTAVIE